MSNASDFFLTSSPGSVLVGQSITLSALAPIRYELEDGRIFLRSGYIETDPLKFDSTFWDKTKGIYLLDNKLVDADGALLICPIYAKSTDNTTIVVAGNRSADNISYKSTDGGLNWTTGSPFGTGATLTSLSTNGTNQWIATIANSANNIQKSDNGTSWVPVTSGFTSNVLSSYFQNGRWFAGSSGQGLRTSDDRNTWTSRFAGGAIVNKITGDGVSKVWAVSDMGTGDNTSKIYYSSDNGTNWSAAANLPYINDVRSITYNNGRLIVAGTAYSSDNPYNIGFIYSDDDGATWDISNVSLLSEDANLETGDFFIVDNEIWYIVDAINKNYRSSDSGVTFKETLHSFSARSAATSSISSKALFSSTAGWFYITTNSTLYGFRTMKTNNYLAAGELKESGVNTESTRSYMRIK